MNISGHKAFFLDDWRVSPPEGLLARGGDTARLEPKAMEVLVYLASRPGEVITREELEQNVWHGAVVGYDAVTNTVIKLRKALHDDPRHPRFIATVPKIGYQLIASITHPENAGSPGPATPAAGEPIGPAQRKRPSFTMHRAIIVIAVLAGIFAVALMRLWPADSDTSVTLPSIVVLPFENLSDDPKQEYLADGITEDLITDLSRLSNVLVIASNTSFKYKGKQAPLEQVGTDLDVEFVLKGTIRQLGDEFRVTAQLVNTKTGFNAWAQRYDRKLTELFAVQDEVTQSIVNALAVKITSQEKQRLSQRATDNLKAYDFFQEGQRLFKVNTKEANEQAREMYRQAISLDPGYGRAYGALAVTLIADFRNGWAYSPLETLDRALELATKAVALDDSTPQTYWALSFVHLWRKEYDRAEQAVAQAIRVAPNYADGYGLLALIKSYSGQPERAVELTHKAVRYNPYYTFEYLITFGMAYYASGDYNAAIRALEEARERNENSSQIKLLLAASYVKANRQDDAEWVADELRILAPSRTVGGLEKTFPIKNPELKRAFLEDLRKAGLPE